MYICTCAAPNGAVDNPAYGTTESSSGGLAAVDVDSAVGFVRLRSTMQTEIPNSSIAYDSDRPFSSSGRNISVQQQRQQLLFEPMNDAATPADDSEALEELENRLRDWLTVDCGTSVIVADGGTASQRQQQELLQLSQRGATRPRISRLHRASTEVKPCSKLTWKKNKS